jgi:CMP-N-acetylneuraminic acid synthetase
MIPARQGSERLKEKNLAEINGNPVVFFGIEIAKNANCFDAIVINSDIKSIEKIARDAGVDFYLRASNLAQSETTSDEVVYDFFKKFEEAEIVVWINSISPLQNPNDIKNALEYFDKENIDSLISSFLFSRHGLYQGVPINFSKESNFSRTQDLKPIEILTYSFMIWRRAPFMKSFEDSGSAILAGKFSTYPVDFDSLIAIKEQKDLDLIRQIVHSK